MRGTYRHPNVYDCCLNNKPVCSRPITRSREMGHEADGPADKKGLGKPENHHSYSW